MTRCRLQMNTVLINWTLFINHESKMHVSFIPVFSGSFSAEVQEQRWWWSFCYLFVTPKGLKKNIISLSILAAIPFCIYPFPHKVTQCVLTATFIHGAWMTFLCYSRMKSSMKTNFTVSWKRFLLLGQKKILAGQNPVIYWAYAPAHT